MALTDILFKKKQETQRLTDDQVADKKFVENFYDEGIKARQGIEKLWYINMAYYLGKQWLSWNKTKRQLEVPQVPTWRVRMVVNKIKPNVQHILAKIVKNKPTYIALPATGEDADLNRAEISGKCLKYLHRINKMDILNQRLCLLKIIFGTSFKDSYFDSTKGVHRRRAKMITLTNKETGEDYKEQLRNDQGEPQFHDIHTGEVKTEILPPFSIIPEGAAENLEDSFRVMKAVTKPVEYIRRVYAEGKYVHSETSQPGSSLEKQLSRLIGQEQTPTHIIQKKDKTQDSGEGFVTIKELREKPSHKYPKGRLIRVANGVLLDSGPLPYAYMIKRQTLGIVKYDYSEVPGRFWGATPVDDMIAIQTELNKTISQLTEIKNLMSKPKWITFKENKLPKTSITSEPGEVLEVKYVPNVPEPHPVTMPSVPAYVQGLVERADKDMSDVALIHEVSTGQAPPGVKSGVAVQFLAEQDQTVFGPVISRFETCEGEAGTYQLEIVKERYREPRLLKIVGENNSIEVFDFKATEDMPTDVIVESGSSLPQSMVAKQQLILQQFEKGMYGNIEDPKVQRKALRLSEIGALDVVYEEAAADEREAEREHKLWEASQVAFIQFYDNHAVHSERHKVFCKSDRFRNLVAQEPAMFELIKEHIGIHDSQDPAKIAQQEQEQMMKNQVGLDNQLKVKDDKRQDVKTDDEHAETISKIMTDVKERQMPLNQPMGGT